jgi:ABC-type nitrate/sulfonate/bicarbonate transport system permease component
LRAARFALSLAGFVLLWGVVAALAGSSDLPTPWAVAAFIVDDISHGDMLFNIGMTLWRAALSFSIAMILGCGLGFVFGRLPRMDEAFMPWVLVLMNTPVLVIAVLCFIWFRTTEASAILAVVLSKFPNNTIIIRDGVRSFDPGLDDVASIYKFSLAKRFRHILLPQAMPFVMAAARSGIGIVWKIVLVVELFGLSSGVGFEISKYFGLFAVKEIIGYSVAFSLVMLAVELLLLQPLDDYARRWRSAAS